MSDQQHRVGEIRAFCRQERLLAVLVIIVGLSGMAGGLILLLTPDYGRTHAGIVAFLMSIPIISFGLRLFRRSKDFLITQSGDPDAGLREYVHRGEAFIVSINKTRNVSALVMAVSIVGIIVACLVERLAFTAWTWIIVTVATALLSLAAYYHVFRLEIHLHEISREATNDMTGENDS